jgi:hypothetical protein
LTYIVNSTIENRFCGHFIPSFTFWMRFSQHTFLMDVESWKDSNGIKQYSYSLHEHLNEIG